MEKKAISCYLTIWLFLSGLAFFRHRLALCLKMCLTIRDDVEAAISSTASASTPVTSASNRTWTLTEPGLYLTYELAVKHDYQNQQLTIYKGTLLVKMIA